MKTAQELPPACWGEIHLTTCRQCFGKLRVKKQNSVVRLSCQSYRNPFLGFFSRVYFPVAILLLRLFLHKAQSCLGESWQRKASHISEYWFPVPPGRCYLTGTVGAKTVPLQPLLALASTASQFPPPVHSVLPGLTRLFAASTLRQISS